MGRQPPSGWYEEYIMRIKNTSLAGIALAISVTLLYPSGGWSQTFKILHSFGGPGDGTQPVAGLVFGPDGKLYGGTSGGGNIHNAFCFPAGCGTVFQLTPNSDGTWTETVIHNFNGRQGAGTSFEAPLFDNRGNLYGTTGGGGAHNLGTVFELSPNGSDGWNFSSLYSFQNTSDGWSPSGIAMRDGTLYATASWGGGDNDQGSVISLTHTSVTGWAEQTLHDFNTFNDGWLPSGLVFDAAGNAYGTTFYSGADVGQGCGTGIVYKLTQNPQTRRWIETILYDFKCGQNDGANPSSTVVFDAAGNLYSTTAYGGLSGWGTVFKLTPNPDGSWSETILWNFEAGAQVYAGVTFDASGNLYGVTEGTGDVYKLTPSSGGQWTETILHHFNGQDGAYPFASVILDSAGNIYGTTQLGGTYNQGVVFEVTP